MILLPSREVYHLSDNKCARCEILLKVNLICHFTVVCLVITWPMTAREAGGDLALINTSLCFLCKCKLVSITT